MKHQVKKTREQWDDVPAKVVGKRGKMLVDVERGEAFLRLGKDMGIRLPHRPKGVFRYKTHEDVDP